MYNQTVIDTKFEIFFSSYHLTLTVTLMYYHTYAHTLSVLLHCYFQINTKIKGQTNLNGNNFIMRETAE